MRDVIKSNFIVGNAHKVKVERSQHLQPRKGSVLCYYQVFSGEILGAEESSKMPASALYILDLKGKVKKSRVNPPQGIFEAVVACL